jgi:uncharacterized protein YbjT (DUF2867 family)
MTSEAPRRVFMTGATGYLGSRLIPLLLARGHRVTALARPESAARIPVGCESAIGDALDVDTFRDPLHGADVVVQLVGVPKPTPWKGGAFRRVDGPSARATSQAAVDADIRHFVYVSVAHPAPIMKDYIAVRTSCERALIASALTATIFRPWYILGPGHWWPIALLPAYWLMERLPKTREAALRLGLVTLDDMLQALVWAIEHPPAATRIIEVPEIRRLGRRQR